jgi:hypothetical protein
MTELTIVLIAFSGEPHYLVFSSFINPKLSPLVSCLMKSDALSPKPIHLLPLPDSFHECYCNSYPSYYLSNFVPIHMLVSFVILYNYKSPHAMVMLVLACSSCFTDIWIKF